MESQEAKNRQEIHKASEPQLVYVGVVQERKDKDNRETEEGCHLTVRKGKRNVRNLPGLIVTNHAVALVLKESTKNGTINVPRTPVQRLSTNKLLQPHETKGRFRVGASGVLQDHDLFVADTPEDRERSGRVVQRSMVITATQSQNKVKRPPEYATLSIFLASFLGQLIWIHLLSKISDCERGFHIVRSNGTREKERPVHIVVRSFICIHTRTTQNGSDTHTHASTYWRPRLAGNIFPQGRLGQLDIIPERRHGHGRQQRGEMGQFLQKETRCGHASAGIAG